MEEDLRRAAVEQAYREHVDDVFRVAFAILGDRDSASDATHDAFARAYERWEQYDALRPVRPWLQRIAANVALDVLRHRRVRPIVPLADDAVPTTSVVGRSEDPVGAVERRQLVEEGLAELRPTARAAIVLRHYYGYGYAEIAEIMGTTPGTVGSILSRAHAQLRASLTATGGSRTAKATARIAR